MIQFAKTGGHAICPRLLAQELLSVMSDSSYAFPLSSQHMMRARDIAVQVEDESSLLEMCDNNLQTIRAARESAAEFQQLLLKHKKNQRAFTRARWVHMWDEMVEVW